MKKIPAAGNYMLRVRAILLRGGNCGGLPVNHKMWGRGILEGGIWANMDDRRRTTDDGVKITVWIMY